MKTKFSFSAILFFLLMCLGIQTTTAQTLDWVRTADSYTKYGTMIARDANDNVVSCGYTIHDRMFTRKWDKLGNFLWEKESVSGIFNYRERPTWIATDNSNNIITLGYQYYGTSDQQPGALVILKYAPNGTLLFKRTINGAGGVSSRCELDPAGNIYIGVAATITGQPDFGFNLIKLDPNGNILFISTHNFGSYFSVNNMRYRNGKIALTGISSLQGYSFNCTTALFDANGNYLWGVVSSILYSGVDVEVDNNGNVYVVNLDYTSGRNGDIQVTKYSVTGTVLFTYFYDKSGHAESPSRINIQPDGNVVVSGVCTSPVTGLETFKLSSTGSLMWEAFHSAPYTDIPQLYFMATNPVTSEVFLTGTSSISGNPASIFTIKYDSFGNESWVAKYDSTATRGTGLAIASDGSVFVVGLNWWTVLHYLNGNVPNPCSIPANLSTTGITSVAATFSWSAVPGAASYNVRYRVVGTTTWSSGTTTTTSLNAAGLTANTNYEWQVQTVCSGGNSLFTASATFTTAAVPVCNAPTGITTANITSSSATFSWSAVTGAASYNVHYRVVGAATWTTGTTTTTSLNAVGLTANTNYEWQLQTACSGGNSSFTTSTTFTTAAVAVCNAPTGMTTANITSSSATFSWSAVSGAASYNVHYRVVGAATWTTGTTTTTSLNVAGLTANTKYEWQLQTACSGGNSSFTVSTTFTTALATCSNIALGKTATGSGSSGSNTPNQAVDGNVSTFWRSTSGGTQYLQVDFGVGTLNYSQATIKWRGTHNARSFQIRVSNNANFSTFTTVFSTTTGSGGNQIISLSGAPRTERYIRLRMTQVNSSYYAVNEFEVCGFRSSALSMAAAIPKELPGLLIQSSDINIFPNPVKDELRIMINRITESFVIDVFDIYGRKMISRQATQSTRIDVGKLASGIYFVRVATKQGMVLHQEKIMKE